MVGLDPLNDLYILDGREPVRAPDVRTWGEWFHSADRCVAFSELGDVQVSTVFLGIDHSIGLLPGPILFETMVSGGPLDDERKWYRTWDEAEKGHAAMVALVMAAEKNGAA